MVTVDPITSYNLSAGAHVLLIYVNNIPGGMFVRVFLFMIWISIVLGLFFFQKKAQGSGDFPMAMVTGSIVTLITALLLRLIENGNISLLDNITYAVVFVITIVSILIFLFNKGE